MPHQKENSAPLVGGNRAHIQQRTDQARSKIEVHDTAIPLSAQLSDLLESHDDLRCLRRVQTGLEHRARYARLRREFGLADFDSEELLAEEVREFKLVCKSLAASRRAS